MRLLQSELNSKILPPASGFLNPPQKAFFDRPGEIRNHIYDLLIYASLSLESQAFLRPNDPTPPHLPRRPLPLAHHTGLGRRVPQPALRARRLAPHQRHPRHPPAARAGLADVADAHAVVQHDRHSRLLRPPYQRFNALPRASPTPGAATICVCCCAAARVRTAAPSAPAMTGMLSCSTFAPCWIRWLRRVGRRSTCRFCTSW